MKIINSLLTKNPCYKQGVTMVVKGLVLHSVGCSQPNASVFVNAWNNPSYDRACVHAFIDGNSGDVYQCLPWNYKGWHVGGSANNTHIGVEMCEAATISYSSGGNWTDKNPVNTKATVMRTYASAVELFAQLCKTYNLNPLQDGVIISHAEAYKRGLGSNHGDPEHVWNKFGLTMNQFRNDVANAMKGISTPTTPTEPSATDKTVLYKVQVGAFTVKANADEMLVKLKSSGFNGFVSLVNGLYKVQVGAFSVKANANTMLSEVKAKGYDAFITTATNSVMQNTSNTDSTINETKKSIEEIAKEVIAGKWGTGETRKQRLTAAGYDYAAVQAKVNALLK